MLSFCPFDGSLLQLQRELLLILEHKKGDIAWAMAPLCNLSGCFKSDYRPKAARAWLAMVSNAAFSLIASSERTLRSISMLAFFKPFMNLL